MLNDHLKALIDDADIVSFDVFDTLLLRRHYSPPDVFTHAGGTQRWFRLMRIAAEQAARFRHQPKQDVTLEQIYAVLRLSPDRELLAEEQTLFANPAARVIYDYAIANGKTVIAISDMYLPHPFLKERIERAGYADVHKVYVSCEFLLTKTTGDLYRHVAEDLGVAPARILHVGDNEQSDVMRARERGLQAWYLPSPRARFEAANAVHPEIVRYLQRGRHPMHSLLLGILRDGLGDPSHDYWYRLGFSVAGPIVNAFADWIQDRFQQGRHHGVFLFARDGHLPQQVLALRYPQVPTHYTFASRRLFLVAALGSLNETNLRSLLAAPHGTQAREYWNRLGIANRAVEELMASRFAPGEKISSAADRQRLEAFFREAHPLMLEDVGREHQALRGYLSSIGMLAPNARPLIVDIGWRASSQRFLEMAVSELKGTSGAYFGLSDDAYRNGNMTGWFFDGYTHLRARRIATECVEIMELLFSAPHPSVRRVDAFPDGTFAPVYEPAGAEEERRMAVVRKIHEGAIDFTRALVEHELAGYPIRISREDVTHFIHALIQRPTAEDIRHLGGLPHAVGLGASQSGTLLPQNAQPRPLAVLMKNLGKSPIRLPWPGGLTRIIGLRHGIIREVSSRLIFAAARAILAGRERLAQLLGK